jgi:two-component system, sensor histidine kinase
MSDRSNPRVLVVDDSCDTADSLAELLTFWGYDAEACYDGAAALEVARLYLPNVVLLDVAMPGMDGFQVALGLRKVPGLANAMIIGISGYTSAAYRVRAGDAGFDLCLVKPVEIDSFRELIGRIASPAAEAGTRRRGVITANGGRHLRNLFAN